MRLLLSAVAVLIGVSGLAGGVAQAQPSTPAPPPVPGSTNDDLADMVMDAIEHGSAPTTTPVPPPPG
jgi:hypothetical protein